MLRRFGGRIARERNWIVHLEGAVCVLLAVRIHVCTDSLCWMSFLDHPSQRYRLGVGDSSPAPDGECRERHSVSFGLLPSTDIVLRADPLEVVGPALARGTGHSWAVEHS